MRTAAGQTSPLTGRITRIGPAIRVSLSSRGFRKRRGRDAGRQPHNGGLPLAASTSSPGVSHTNSLPVSGRQLLSALHGNGALAGGAVRADSDHSLTQWF